MDWKMPVMDGIDAVRHLHSDQLSRVPTVIMVTAYGREDALASANDARRSAANRADQTSHTIHPA
jgi:two-component system sensor histidine kinase/response regulator